MGTPTEQSERLGSEAPMLGEVRGLNLYDQVEHQRQNVDDFITFIFP